MCLRWGVPRYPRNGNLTEHDKNRWMERVTLAGFGGIVIWGPQGIPWLLAKSCQGAALMVHGRQKMETYFEHKFNNVCKTTINHPPVITRNRWYKPFPTGWFIMVYYCVISPHWLSWNEQIPLVGLATCATSKSPWDSMGNRFTTG